jgi:hypothetical protein
MSEEVGGMVGYQVRFEERIGPRADASFTGNRSSQPNECAKTSTPAGFFASEDNESDELIYCAPDYPLGMGTKGDLRRPRAP